jgi:phosphoribosylformylglycinamidine cyclo-ligase
VPEEAASIVAGVAEGCQRAGCALLGGETAEHPGTMEPGGFDLAGFCIGLVRAEDVVRVENVRPGDALIGLRSSGLHSNGFSLVRRALLGGDERDDLEKVKVLDEFRHELGRTLGEELLEPTRIYVQPVLALARAGLLRSAAHITGGGWFENVPRALPPGLGAEIHVDAWEAQPVFAMVAHAAGLTTRDLFGVLNMGIGMVLVVSADEQDRALALANASGVAAVAVGWVAEGDGVRFVEPA